MKIIHVFLLLLTVSLMTSCDDEVTVDPIPELVVPTSYNFENVSYGGQQSRLAQFSELKSYMGTSKTSGVALDADKLAAMYANEEGAGFSQVYTKNLRSKTFESVQADFDALFVELAEASQSTVAGSEGVAGVIESNDGAKSYLIGADGLDHAQVIEKSLMGACLYYQATSVYFGDAQMNVDNTIVEPGEGTEMEHHWDEAFGYFGAPIDFPVTTNGIVFWADYADKRESVLGNSQSIMDALLKGRAAISGDRIELRDEAITEARKQWELISVAGALHYLNVGISDFNDVSIRAHGLSEAIGFIYSLQFNDGKLITNNQVSDLLTTLASSANFADMDINDITVAELESARETLASIYDLTARQTEF
ncbi:MAG: hypothetical protein ACI85O_000596 [Saprospiraceae bacterium]|jgi:hypothetical protein